MQEIHWNSVGALQITSHSPKDSVGQIAGWKIQNIKQQSESSQKAEVQTNQRLGVGFIA